MAKFQPYRLEARFWNKVGPEDSLLADAECWPWGAAIAKATGYGSFTVEHNWTVLAHAFAYTVTHGPVPAGLEIDHVCHSEDGNCPGGLACPHRRCVNPDHLEPVTRSQNMLRARHYNKVKTHCPNNHPYSGANLIIYDGRRFCRECKRVRWYADEARRRRLNAARRQRSVEVRARRSE